MFDFNPAITSLRIKSLALVLGLLWIGLASVASGESTDAITKGRAIAFDSDRGNCLTCHAIANGSLPGNAGPELRDIAVRFADRDALRARIYDARKLNPDSIMPPYGRNGLLTNEEIDLLVAFVWQL